MNHVIKQMWPHIGKVVFKQAVEQAKPILDDICTKVPIPSAATVFNQLPVQRSRSTLDSLDAGRPAS